MSGYKRAPSIFSPWQKGVSGGSRNTHSMGRCPTGRQASWTAPVRTSICYAEAGGYESYRLVTVGWPILAGLTAALFSMIEAANTRIGVSLRASHWIGLRLLA